VQRLAHLFIIREDVMNLCLVFIAVVCEYVVRCKSENSKIKSKNTGFCQFVYILGIYYKCTQRCLWIFSAVLCIFSHLVDITSEFNLEIKRMMFSFLTAVYVTVWSAWLSGRTSVSGQRSFAVLRSTCSWWVTTYVGKPSAIGQPTRPTQPFILSGLINE